ncbi:NUDIX domain-containing protein [Mucilaginibacter sp. PAMB04168]|uniref:NUDIX domain-containing protein n=1 Tax=Mucilaginibacter sp. PAMB04168 TaxID=3138567 RepID=UPI0031F67DE1
MVGDKESLEEAVQRELKEETGININYLEQLYSFGQPGRDPRNRVVSITYYGLVKPDAFELQASTDAGRAKWVESLANDLGVNAAFILKRRLKGDHTEVSAINADVAGKTVIIYDDMIRSGGSIINAAKTYKDAGAAAIFVITTHGLFINDGVNKLKSCGLIEKLICTDSHVNTQGLANDDFVEVKSVAQLICEVI